MVTEIKELLNRADIRTMRKDIRQLKKFGFLAKPSQEIKLITKVQVTQSPKEDLREKETRTPFLKGARPSTQDLNALVLEKILGEAAKQRQITEKPVRSAAAVAGKEQPAARTLANEPKNNTETFDAEVKNKTQVQQSQQKETLSQSKERGWMKQMPEATKEKIKTIREDEKERRRKFMEDIERWAQENK